MTEDLRARAIALYDRFTHDGLDRRAFITRMTALAGSLAAAEALIATIAASPAAAAIVPADDKRLRTFTDHILGNNGRPLYTAYVAAPRGRAARRATVMVIHENRGLNDHIRDVARRLALAGYYAYAPDMLSPVGSTPTDEDKARTMIGALDLGKAVDDAVAMLALLRPRAGGNGRVGVVGFCWGGAFVNRLAVAAGSKLDAGVAYYGPAPAPAEAAKVQAPLMLHYAGLDDRVAATGQPWIAALQAAHKRVEAFTYPGVDHAFNNDTSAERFNGPAAALAWQRTLAFFARTLQ